MDCIENIEDSYSKNNNWYAAFDCPSCFQEWGPSNDSDPPGNIDHTVKCNCGALLQINGEWANIYDIEVNLIDE